LEGRVPPIIGILRLVLFAWVNGSLPKREQDRPFRLPDRAEQAVLGVLVEA